MDAAEIKRFRSWKFAPDSAEVPSGSRMALLDINAPGVTGYSACWAGNVMMLYAHTPGMDSTFFRDFSASYRRPIWIHMPIDPGERVVEMWGRRGKTNEHMGLVVS